MLSHGSMRTLVMEIRMRGMDDGCSKCQFMHSDIKNCKLEIQEVKQLVIGLQQSHREDMKKISKMVMDLMESFKSGREGVARENGGDRIVRSDIIVLNDDDSDDSLDADPLNMYKNFVSSGGKKIGPFRLSQPLSDADSNKIVLYIVDKSLDESSSTIWICGVILTEPTRTLTVSGILDAYASILNGVVGLQYEIPENRECWFLPSSLSMEAKDVGLDRLLDDMDLYDAGVVQWREYFGNLSKCSKFVIPVSLFGYWVVAVINLREENVELWDYVVVAKPESISDREKAVIEMLRLLDHVLADVLADGVNMAFPNGLSLQSFKIIHKKYEHCIEKFLDSAIYIMRHMWAASKGLDSFPKFNPKEFLLEAYIELVRSQFNEVSASMLEKSGAHYDSLIRETKRAGKGKMTF
ncbi:hypothetical protein TIFTF001_036572 [Ficus carica]|uniref:Ubiquitin-like protease family profile domain-containing protein n=1 Tax=Ficus carica TaxID=3494 RepID=A0AA88J7V3_FICCA|nr:hypothetical protein TIFTF001_036572 [Ficus carica]